MSRHRKIDVRLWGDAKFCSLSKPQPNAQTLWIYLLTGPHTTSIPGIFVAGEAGMAEAIGWPLEAFREAFLEALNQGMVKADFSARVVWIPNAVFYNQPASPNVVKSWKAYWDEIPECDLKTQCYQAIKDFLKGIGEGFLDAFVKACHKASAKDFTQEQEQEQEQEKEVKTPKKKFEPTGVTIPKALESQEFRTAWDEWIAYRRERRLSLTERTVNKQLTDFAEWGKADAVEAISTAIRNGYQGVFRPKENGKPMAAKPEHKGPMPLTDAEVEEYNRTGRLEG